MKKVKKGDTERNSLSIGIAKPCASDHFGLFLFMYLLGLLWVCTFCYWKH